jgi:predicted transcriptional regulator
VLAGYQVVPDVLVRYQGRLGLSPTDLCVLLNLGAHWWYPESQPSPRSSTIARRMNIHVRQVQRSLRALKDAGLIDVQKENGRRSYDLKPLVKSLERLAEKELGEKESREAARFLD